MDTSTIRGYRSMLANTYQISLESIGSNVQLSNLVRNFAISAQKVKRKIPSWSLNCVLSYLEKAEPLHSLSLNRLTMKTVFLVSLATAKRVSELQALYPDISFRITILSCILRIHFWLRQKMPSIPSLSQSNFVP